MKSRRTKVLVTLLTLSLILSAALPTERYFEIAKSLDIFATLFKEVNAYYVDEIEPDQLIRTGIDAMLESLDPYTTYIPEDEIESFKTMTSGQYAGIGALIGNINDKVVITMPYEGFAAKKGGLRIGDEIIKINGKEVDGLAISEISTLLKGPVRTELNIVVKRPGIENQLEFTLKREKITVVNVPYYGMIDSEIGYIKLEDFTINASEEVENALIELKNKGATKVILDVRNNPGGLLSEAINTTNIFIPKNKEVVSTKGKVIEWNKTYKTLNQPNDTKIPLVVLTNGGSASAAEIVSGVIQDYDRGVLIGTKTFGKGLVQTTRPLTYNTQLKITTAKYYIPSGRCIQSLDYSNRNDDGSVDAVPDSMKVQFLTKNGRPVYDGEGLSPDVIVEQENFAPITISLINKGLIFEYASLFANKNQSSISESFRLNEKEFNEFKSWLSTKDYDYETKVERMIQELEDAANMEKYITDIKTQLDQLSLKVKHNKEQDLIKFKSEIVHLLQKEIIERNYLQKGGIRYSLNYDVQVKKAIEILNNKTTFEQTLSTN